MECEMCGRKVERTRKVRVDAAILNVCDACARFGTPLEDNRPRAQVKQEIVVRVPQKPPESLKPREVRKAQRKVDDVERFTIVEDYARLIQQARNRLSMTQEDLAKKILERKNVLASVERGDLMPDLKMARKLERVLGIKLIEEE
ncbi:transcriptional regulator [Thermogymnomonas acidicola]|uniref:Transcriptional regulator n=1 Tax=Thermogymnomonas acidicola TaxID=399579 RepID=A0AA37F9F6_9ARCH|nr:multiprotein bridging factor aMBF1 [Thermogymnomonas acidicola]GGM73936.1 transcriptional regulator [Thermogymnomonas acidicola]